MPMVIVEVEDEVVYKTKTIDNHKAFIRANEYLRINKMHIKNKKYQVYVLTDIHRKGTPVLLINDDGSKTYYNSIKQASFVTGIDRHIIIKNNLI